MQTCMADRNGMHGSNTKIMNIRRTVLYTLHTALLLIATGYVITLYTSSTGIMIQHNEEPARTYVEDGTNIVRFINDQNKYTIIPQDDTLHAIRTYRVNYDPYGKMLVFAGYLLLALSMTTLAVIRNKRKLFPALIAAVIGSAYYILRYSFKELPSVLQSPWLFYHVMVIMSAYSLFAYIAIRQIIKPIKKGDITSYLLMACTLLCIGIILGSVWASQSWGAYWNWDPKETWALITLLVYILPLHRKPAAFLNKGLRMRIYLTASLLVVIFTYFGVNYLLGGMHSYV